MKKRHLKKLNLKRNIVSNLEKKSITGGVDLPEEHTLYCIDPDASASCLNTFCHSICATPSCFGC